MQQYYSPNDPNDRPRPQLQPARLWPYVLAGLLFALCLLASFEPIPHQLTNAERIWFCQSDLHC